MRRVVRGGVGSVAFAQREDTYNRARVVVRFLEGNEPGNPAGDALVEYMRARRFERVAYIDRVYIFHVGRELGEERRAVAERWPGVEFAEFDIVGRLASSPPNDPFWCDLWGFENRGQTVNGSAGTAKKDICAVKGWSTTYDASSVTIAVLDTGANWQHPDLDGNIWVNSGEIPNNSVDDDSNGYVDDVNGVGVEDDPYIDPLLCFAYPLLHPFAEGNPQDMFPGCTQSPPLCFSYNVTTTDEGSHGTAVSAVIGAIGNNNYQLAGVAWKASIMPIRITACDLSFGISSMAKGFAYASIMGARVANCSWSPVDHSQALELMMKKTKEDGMIVVFCAGNSSVNLDSSPPPTARLPQAYNYNNIVVVMGVDQAGAKWSASNYGTISVDIAGPSSNIRIFDNLRVTPAVQHYISGTSFAAPMAAGMCALIWSQNPTWTYSQVISQLYSSGTTDAGLAAFCTSGKRLNLAQAVGATCPDCRPTVCFQECP